MSKINKSAWIRSQASDLSAKEVVEKAASEGISLSVAQVYTARSTAGKGKKVVNKEDAFIGLVNAAKAVGGIDNATKFITDFISNDAYSELTKAVNNAGGSEKAIAFLERLRGLERNDVRIREAAVLTRIPSSTNGLNL